MHLSPKKRIATYAVAATAVMSAGAGTLAALTADGAQAADTTTPTTAAAATAAAPADDLPPPPDGGPGDRGGVAHIDDVAIAATALGLDPAALKTELAAGKSISQVAKEKGLDVQKAIDAITAADTRAIDDAVTAGTLPADQAATMKAGLTAHVTDEVNRVGFGAHMGRGHGGPPPQGSASTSATPSSVTTD
jgi:hypothetical protein